MKIGYDQTFSPPAPAMEIRLGVPDEALAVGPIPALVDTGADISLIPSRFIWQLGIPANDRKNLRSQWGETRKVEIYFLDIQIGSLKFPLVEIVADDKSDEAIIGRNVINLFNLHLNGPQQWLEITE